MLNNFKNIIKIFQFCIFLINKTNVKLINFRKLNILDKIKF